MTLASGWGGIADDMGEVITKYDEIGNAVDRNKPKVKAFGDQAKETAKTLSEMQTTITALADSMHGQEFDMAWNQVPWESLPGHPQQGTEAAVGKLVGQFTDFAKAIRSVSPNSQIATNFDLEIKKLSLGFYAVPNDSIKVLQATLMPYISGAMQEISDPK